MRSVARLTWSIGRSNRLAALVITAMGAAMGAAMNVGCRHETLPARDLTEGPVVASVAGTPIYAAAVARQMRHTGVDARRALDQLLTFEILASAAAAAVPGTPTVSDRQALQSAKVERLLARDIEPRLTPQSIGEGEVRKIYERAKQRFVHGRQVETAILGVFTGARMKPEPRARAEVVARQVKAALAGRLSLSRADFEAIAKDPLWIERKVAFTSVWQGEDYPFPKVVGRAVQALSKPGQVTDVVGDETGYYIALYLSEKPPQDVPFADAALTIQKEMYEPWRRQRFLQLALAMAEGHDIEVFPENFSLLNQAREGTTAPSR